MDTTLSSSSIMKSNDGTNVDTTPGTYITDFVISGIGILFFVMLLLLPISFRNRTRRPRQEQQEEEEAEAGKRAQERDDDESGVIMAVDGRHHKPTTTSERNEPPMALSSLSQPLLRYYFAVISGAYTVAGIGHIRVDSKSDPVHSLVFNVYTPLLLVANLQLLLFATNVSAAAAANHTKAALHQQQQQQQDVVQKCQTTVVLLVGTFLSMLIWSLQKLVYLGSWLLVSNLAVTGLFLRCFYFCWIMVQQPSAQSSIEQNQTTDGSSDSNHANNSNNESSNNNNESSSSNNLQQELDNTRNEEKDRQRFAGVWSLLCHAAGAMTCALSMVIQFALGWSLCQPMDGYQDCPLPATFNHNALFHVIFSVGLFLQGMAEVGRLVRLLSLSSSSSSSSSHHQPEQLAATSTSITTMRSHHLMSGHCLPPPQPSEEDKAAALLISTNKKTKKQQQGQECGEPSILGHYFTTKPLAVEPGDDEEIKNATKNNSADHDDDGQCLTIEEDGHEQQQQQSDDPRAADQVAEEHQRSPSSFPTPNSSTFSPSAAAVLAKTNAPSLTTTTTTTMVRLLRFASGMAGYRIVRLSMELFLVLRIQELDWPVRQAGIIFLVYTLVNILAGLLFMAIPLLFLGTWRKAVTYFVVTTGAMTVGFVATFQVQHEWAMALAAGVCGFGTAAWNINYQTLTNMTFPKTQLGTVAFMRQLFETIGFLLPSICLAIVLSVDSSVQFNIDIHNDNGEEEEQDNNDDANNGGSGGTSVVQQSTAVLGAIAAMFHLLSMDQIIRAAARASLASSSSPTDSSSSTSHDKNKEEEEGETLWSALVTFFGTSVVKYYLLNAILLSVSNILMATMSLITETYFDLEPTFLWIAAIGFPIGGIVSVAAKMLSSSSSDQNAKSAVLAGTTRMAVVFSLCLALSPIGPPDSDQLAKSLLFFFGFVMGMIYSVTFASSLELWLLKLKDYGAEFVSRASVINNLGVQAIIAMVFQVQIALVSLIEEKKGSSSSSVVAEAFVFFAPSLVLSTASWLIVSSLPYPKDSTFGWPIPTPFSPGVKAFMHILDSTGALRKEDFSFARFGLFRVSFLDPHLKDAAPSVGCRAHAMMATLCPDGLEKHLKVFDKLGTDEDWWRSKARLCSILLDNEAALEKRLDLVENATSTIVITTWVFEESEAGNRLADALIRRAREGLDIRVIVDAVTLYLSHQRRQILGSTEMDILTKLAACGIQIRMLDVWFEDKEPSYVIGSHRKIMIVDDEWVVTGGRNINDKYFTSGDKFHYKDSDIIVRGEFRSTLSDFYDSLWHHARDTGHMFEKGALKPTRTEHPERRSSSSSVVLPDVAVLGFVENERTSRRKEAALSHSLRLRDSISEQGKWPFSDASSAPASALQGSPCVSSVLPETDITTFFLDHKGGDPDGHDIIFSSLVYLIQAATESIDLVFGYFQLFPELNHAITQAVERGVKVRLITNSKDTNGLLYFNEVFGRAVSRLLELGVSVYVPCKEDETAYCLHYKMAVFDSQAVLIGSWNCMGTSVFYDSDFSVVLFAESGAGASMFQSFADLVDNLIQTGRLVSLDSAEGFEIPFAYKLFSLNKVAASQMERGF